MKLHIVIFFLFFSLSASYPHTTDYYRQTSYTPAYPVYVGTTDGTRRSGSSSGHGGSVGSSARGKMNRNNVRKEILELRENGHLNIDWDYELEKKARSASCTAEHQSPLVKVLLSPFNEYYVDRSTEEKIRTGKLNLVGCSDRPDCEIHGVLCFLKPSPSRSQSRHKFGNDPDDLYNSSYPGPAPNSPTTVASFSSSTHHFIIALLVILLFIFF